MGLQSCKPSCPSPQLDEEEVVGQAGCSWDHKQWDRCCDRCCDLCCTLCLDVCCGLCSRDCGYTFCTLCLGVVQSCSSFSASDPSEIPEAERESVPSL